MLRKIIGVLMLIVFFIWLFILSCIFKGFDDTIAFFGGLALIVISILWVIVGLILALVE